MHRTLISLAALAVAVAAIAGIGYAGIPGQGGVISACKDAKGSLKVIDAEAGQTCNSNQQLLTWNQQGQPGPQGLPGVSGWEIVDGSTVDTETSGAKVALAVCPAGKKPLGGGGSVIGSSVVPYMSTPNAIGWRFGARELTPVDNASYTPTAWVICATVN
jgi:hypothetical protein